MDIDGYKLCALGYRPIGYVMPSAHGPCFVVRSSEKKSKRGSVFFLGLKSAHTDRFSICGNVYDRLDYETPTDRLKLCVIYKYGNNVITY